MSQALAMTMSTPRRDQRRSTVHDIAPNGDRVMDVSFTDHSLVVRLEDGCVLTVPLHCYPALLTAVPSARACWRVSDDGTRIFWPEIGHEFSVARFLNPARSDRDKLTRD